MVYFFYLPRNLNFRSTLSIIDSLSQDALAFGGLLCIGKFEGKPLQYRQQTNKFHKGTLKPSKHNRHMWLPSNTFLQKGQLVSPFRVECTFDVFIRWCLTSTTTWLRATVGTMSPSVILCCLESANFACLDTKLKNII